MIERIEQLLDSKKLTATQFSEEIGVQRSSLSHVLSGRNKPSLDFMLKIKNRYPEINLNWLLLGDGEMSEKVTSSEKLSGEVVSDQLTELNLDKIESEERPNMKVIEEPIQKLGGQQNYAFKASGQANEIEAVITLYGDGSFKIYRQKK